MSNLTRNVVAVIVGLILGSAVNMLVVIAGPMVIPLPDGIDMTNMERFAENLKLLKPANFVPPLLAHAMGTLVGAFGAAKLAASHQKIISLAIAGFFLIGGIMMISMYGGPLWFVLLDLVCAYLPMGFLGGRLGSPKKTID